MRVKMFAACVVLTFLASSAFAIIGPSTAGLTQGGWSLGGNYLYSSQDLDKETIKWRETETGYTDEGDVDYGPITDHGSYKLEIRNMNINRYYGKLGYGLMDTWEVYGQIGIADVKAESKEVDDTEWCGYNLDNDIAYGLGTKYTFLKQESMDWGIGLQVNMYSTSVDDKGTYSGTDESGDYTGSWKETTDIDTMGVTLTVGPTIDMGGWKLYCGGLFTYLTADYNYKENEHWDYDDGYYGYYTAKDSGTYNSNSFGGYVGAQFAVYDNCNVAVEFQGTNDGWAAGAGVEIPF
jgi:hypothetical protein